MSVTGRPASRRTYKVLLGVVPQVQEALGDGLAVLLPFACAEDHLGEVPHPADDGDIGQLLLGQDLGALKQRGPGASVKRGVRPSPGTARELPRKKSDLALRTHRDSSPRHGGREPLTWSRPPTGQLQGKAMPALSHE